MSDYPIYDDNVDKRFGDNNEVPESEFNNTYKKIEKQLGNPWKIPQYKSNQMYPYNEVKNQPNTQDWDNLLNKTDRDSSQIRMLVDVSENPTNPYRKSNDYSSVELYSNYLPDFISYQKQFSEFTNKSGFSKKDLANINRNGMTVKPVKYKPIKKSGMWPIDDIAAAITGDDGSSDVQVMAQKQAEVDAINAQANAQISVARSNEEIARINATRDQNIADLHRQETEAKYRADVEVAKTKEDITKAKFERDKALSDDELQKVISSNNLAQQESANALAATLSHDATKAAIAHDAATTALASTLSQAAVANAAIQQGGETDRTKLLLAEQQNLTSINNQSTTDRAKIEAAARVAAAQEETKVISKLSSDTAATTQKMSSDQAATSQTAIVAANQTAQKVSSDNSVTAQKQAILNAQTIDAVGKNTATAVSNALGVALGPGGVNTLLGTVGDITSNSQAQFNRTLMEQTRQFAIQQAITQSQAQANTNSLLQAQQNNQLLMLQQAKDQSDSALRMLNQLKQTRYDTDANGNPVSNLKPSELLSHLVSTVVVQSILHCQSSLTAEQSINKIRITGSKNVNFKPKQIVTFSANCMQDSTSLSNLQSNIANQIKDFMSLQNTDVLSQMNHTQQSIVPSIHNEIENSFDNKAITEIITDFKLQQSLSDISIENSSDITFAPEQTANLLLQSAQKTTNKLSIITDLQNTADQTFVAPDTQKTKTILGMSQNIFLLLLLIIFIIIISVGYKEKDNIKSLLHMNSTNK